MQRSILCLIVGPHERDLAREILRDRGQVGPGVAVRSLDDRIDADGHAEALCKHPWIQGSHARRVGRQPPRREPPGGLLVRPERYRDGEGDTRRRRHLDTRLRGVAITVSDDGAAHHAYGMFVPGAKSLSQVAQWFPWGEANDAPDQIVIYRDTLTRDFGKDQTLLRAKIIETVRHEVGHALGLDEAGVRKLGL